MPSGAAHRVFPYWRAQWSSLDEVNELLEAADKLLLRRHAGNRRMPKWNDRAMPEKFEVGILALRAWVKGDAPLAPNDRPNIARNMYIAVAPILELAVWPRWLFLEQAFFDASDAGDLLFAAVVLRTMCEEVQRLHAIDLNSDEVAELAGSEKPEDQERLCLFHSIAWTFLDKLPETMVREGDGWPKLNLIAKSLPGLERARAALNSYVHPNYGSHIAALYPERASAARLLLEAVAALYGSFFDLSWAEKPIPGGTRTMGIEPAHSWPKTVRRLQSLTLPELCRGIEDPAVVEVMKVPALIGWVTEKREDLERLINSPELACLLEGLPKLPNVTTQGDSASGYCLWEGARASDVLELANARQAEQLLVSEFSSGAPDPSEQIGWLRFNARSLQLAMLIDRIKAGAFKTQLIRQIVRGNSIGAWLCVRSLIEHRALSTWLPQQLGNSLEIIAAVAQAKAGLPENSKDLAEPLANFLAGQAKGSREDHRAWVLEKHGEIRRARLNLKTVVNAAFNEEDRFHVFYALGSAALHGRAARGLDLMLDAAAIRTSASRVGLLVLERLCNRDQEFGPLRLAMSQSAQLLHAAEFGGTLAAESDVMAGQILGNVDNKFQPGVDYWGEGTLDSPFCIAKHLLFHPTSYAMLEQMGVDPSQISRRRDYDRTGRLCDRWLASKREYWFLTRMEA